MEMQNNADEYIGLYEYVLGKVQDASVASTIIDQIGRDKRCQMLNGSGRVSANEDVPATVKQLAFLRRLNVPVSEGLTKKQASELIDQHAG